MIPDVPYRFAIRPLPEDEGGYLIEFPDLPGCMSDGATIEDAITNDLDAMRGWIEAMRAEGHPIPRRPAPRRPEPLTGLIALEAGLRAPFATTAAVQG
jgi:predicted RNase H-like HicB family nuclease